MGLHTLDASKCVRFYMKKRKYGRYFRDRPISMVVLHVCHDSECGAGVVGRLKKAISVSHNYLTAPKSDFIKMQAQVN